MKKYFIFGLMLLFIFGCSKPKEEVKLGADRLLSDTEKELNPIIKVKEVSEENEPLIIKPSLPSSGSMQVPIARIDKEKKGELLISNGLPFAPSELFSEKNIAFFDENSNEIPIATKILARWPQDNSIRSVLVQFKLGIEKRYRTITMKWGTPRASVDVPLIEVNWEMPEGIILLPAKWLCESRVIGEQIPMDFDRFTGQPLSKYDDNIINKYAAMRDAPWTDDTRTDNYYDTVHVFYQFFVRSGDDEYFKSARREAVHYRDKEIVQEGPERSRNVAQKESRYIFVEAMVDDYLLTGDNKSLTVAGYMAEYLKNNFPSSKAFFPKNASHFWTEREQAFPFLGIIAYYELTGEKEYLEIAKKFMINLYATQNEWPERGGFIHNLYSHDPEEGARRDEYGGSPFMTGLLLESIIKYHQLTNSKIAKDSIFKALDWLMKEALAPDGQSFVYTTAEKNKNEGHPDLNMLIVHAFGYGYKISGYTRTDYLEIGKKIFERGAKVAYLDDRKHFNQNYRSSGHFLAYISEGDIKNN